jgi:hypothetical protein
MRPEGFARFREIGAQVADEADKSNAERFGRKTAHTFPTIAPTGTGFPISCARVRAASAPRREAAAPGPRKRLRRPRAFGRAEEGYPWGAYTPRSAAYGTEASSGSCRHLPARGGHAQLCWGLGSSACLAEAGPADGRALMGLAHWKARSGPKASLLSVLSEYAGQHTYSSAHRTAACAGPKTARDGTAARACVSAAMLAGCVRHFVGRTRICGNETRKRVQRRHQPPRAGRAEGGQGLHQREGEGACFSRTWLPTTMELCRTCARTDAPSRGTHAQQRSGGG